MIYKNYFEKTDTIPKKNKNVLMYSIFNRANVNQNHYISMVHYSLKTLHKYIDFEEFDVLVFLNSDDDLDFLNYTHLGKFNLIKDYPNVIFIKNDYHKYLSGNYVLGMSKWYDIEQCLKYDYEKIFFVDADTIFFSNPQVIFDLGNESVYSIMVYSEDGLYKWLEKEIKGFKSLNSGQILLPKKIKVIENLFKKILDSREYLTKKSKEALEKGEITEKEYKIFFDLNEQWSAEKVLLEHGFFIEPIDKNSLEAWGYTFVNTLVGFGDWNAYWLDIEYNKDGEHTFNTHPIVLWHYSSNSAHSFLPFEYQTELQKQNFNKKTNSEAFEKAKAKYNWKNLEEKHKKLKI